MDVVSVSGIGVQRREGCQKRLSGEGTCLCHEGLGRISREREEKGWGKVVAAVRTTDEDVCVRFVLL